MITDVVAVATERFVNGVVEHLEHHVMQAGAITGVTDGMPGRLRTASRPFLMRIESSLCIGGGTGFFIGIGHETFSARAVSFSV